MFIPMCLNMPTIMNEQAAYAGFSPTINHKGAHHVPDWLRPSELGVPHHWNSS